MRRRSFLASSAAALALPRVALGQQAKLPVVAYFGGDAASLPLAALVLRTARTLGVSFPPGIVATADVVIE